MGQRRNPLAVTLLIFLPFFVLYIVGVVLMTMGAAANPVNVGQLMIGVLLALVGAAWYLIFMMRWFYTTSKEVITVTGQPWSVGLWTFLLLIPIANWVSYYKMAENVNRAQLSKGINGIHYIVTFLLLALVGPVGVPIAQMEMNKLW